MTETPTHLFYRGGHIPVTAVTDTHLFFSAFGAERRVRRAAADAHPDRGGSAGAFMVAHAAYRAAKRRAA